MRSFIKGRYHLNAPQELIVVRLLAMIGIATLLTITSLYLQDLGMSTAQIGLVTSLAYVLGFIFSLILPPILERFNIEKLLGIAIVIFACHLILLGSATTALIAALIFLSARSVMVLIDNTASVLFHDDNPTKKSFYRYQAIASSLINLAWAITPFVAGILVETRSFSFAYMVGAIAMLLGATYLFIHPVPVVKKKRRYQDFSIFSNLRFYFSKKHLRNAYFLSSGQTIWWGFLFTFVGLFMVESGFSRGEVGLFITLTQIPLFLLEFKTDTIVRKYGFRVPFTLAYGLLALVCLFAFLIDFGVWTLGAFLVGSLALVYIEPAREIFIFEGLKKDDEERIYPVYSTSLLVGSVLVRLVVSLAISIWSNSASFLAVGIIFAYLSYRGSLVKGRI